MPPGLELMVPEPLRVIDSTGAKVAVTLRATVIETVQLVLLPEQAPDQLVKE